MTMDVRPLLIVLFTTLAGAAASCNQDLSCRNEVAQRLLSPNRQHVIVIFSRSCDATTGDSIQGSVLPVGEAVQGTGNALIYDTPSRNPAPPRVRWDSDNRVLVVLPLGVRVFKRESNVYGVNLIIYNS